VEGREIAHFLGRFEDLDSLSEYQNTRAAVAGRLRGGPRRRETNNMQHTTHSKGLTKVLGLTPLPKRLAQEDEGA
jgi:hypothetical protein